MKLLRKIFKQQQQGEEGMLTVFNLKEGVAYRALHNGKLTNKQFMVKNGRIMNKYPGDTEFRSYCDHVPANATFIPVDQKLKDPKHKDGKAYLPEFKSGHIYHYYNNYYYARIGGNLHKVEKGDEGSFLVGEVHNENLRIDSEYEYVGPIPLLEVKHD